MQLKCFPVSDPQDMATCHDIRHQVFVDEQNVPEDIEKDGMDTLSRHFAVRVNSPDAEEDAEHPRIIATCRVRLMGSAAKLERVAVLKDFREMGVGRILMKYILQELSKTGDVQLFKLSAQAHTVPFYEKFGFVTRGAEYIEAGMPHYDMILEKV